MWARSSDYGQCMCLAGSAHSVCCTMKYEKERFYGYLPVIVVLQLQNNSVELLPNKIPDMFSCQSFATWLKSIAGPFCGRACLHGTFCLYVQLTGIVQDMVDGQPHLQQVLSQFDVWMREQGLLQARTVFVTFGDWDLQKM